MAKICYNYIDVRQTRSVATEANSSDVRLWLRAEVRAMSAVRLLNPQQPTIQPARQPRYARVPCGSYALVLTYLGREAKTSIWSTIERWE